MKLYIAAPWVDRAPLAKIAAQFEDAGHTVTERWWEHRDVANFPDSTTEQEDHELFEQALKDAQGVFAADLVVVINSSKSEGKAVEQGIAIAAMKPVILIGKRSNIFHWLLPEDFVVETVDEAVRLLA